MSSVKDLEIMANKLRIHSLKSTTAAGSGHPTSCMSAAEIMSTIFFSELEQDDEFILSKGHAAPILWAAYAEAGIIPEKNIETLRKIDSVLEGHPTYRMPLVKVATGSLGQGLNAGVGMALSKKLENNKGRVFVLLGDGETAEGSVWEAANAAAFNKLDNLIAIVDVNRLGQSDPTMHGHELDIYRNKFSAFGWNSIITDGHNILDILKAFDKAKSSNKPFAIIAKTYKGKGVSFLEDKEGWHGKPLSQEELEKALEEISDAEITLPSRLKEKKTSFSFTDYDINEYKIGDKVATRNAFGKGLVNLGSKNSKVVAIDGDVKNSTMTEYFFKEFSDRSFESYIAEQNMVGMAIGFSAMGYIPYVATFSTFFTRAYDFIRMGAYSKANVKFVGSHAGVSIGEDGPSQMGLEDLPMFLCIPNAVVLYPSDAVSTEKLVKETAKHDGISYMRTTRGKTEVIYDNSENFPIGGLKVVRESEQDKALIVAAGITLYETLKAYEELKARDILIRVIDFYSLKPFDSENLIKNAKESGGKVIVVEDHYAHAIGSIVSSVINNVNYLCIKEIPRSGKPDELMKKYGIDSYAIVNLVKEII